MHRAECIAWTESRLVGQHVCLQADPEIAEVYRRLGFREQPLGLSLTVGTGLAGQ